ncbi:MAG TPA: orotidine-5'-phosphate decarboxylase [Longimicrobiales bacterium]|nr:orotidine-5'-phosphate decarboxylase [Longimicrobiales bacterium]
MAIPIVALDLPSAGSALDLVDRLGDEAGFYKIGSPLFTAAGPEVIREVRKRGKRVFLDLKFHDIPSTVAHAVESAARLGVELLTLHASGGLAMLRAARAAAGDDGPRLLGVTVLTSFGADDIQQAWGKEVNSVREEVVRLGALAIEAGLHGVVVSPLEIEPLRRRHGPDILIVAPGIRPSGDRDDDQVRTATPSEAARAGADYIVIGRPITAAADPLAVMRTINAELNTAVAT